MEHLHGQTYVPFSSKLTYGRIRILKYIQLHTVTVNVGELQLCSSRGEYALHCGSTQGVVRQGLKFLHDPDKSMRFRFGLVVYVPEGMHYLLQDARLLFEKPAQ